MIVMIAMIIMIIIIITIIITIIIKFQPSRRSEQFEIVVLTKIK